MVPFGHCGRHTKLWAPTAVLALALASLTLTSAAGVAAPSARPSNTAEPEISGRAEQGRTLSASRGRWTGTGSISYAFRWVRCGANGGRPDGSDCGFILGRHALELPGGQRGCRIPLARSRDGDERRGRADGRVESDCGRRRRSGEHVDPAGGRNGARRIAGHGAARELDRPPADLVLVLVAALQHGRRRVRRDRRAGPELPLRGG